jgi:hypothetical protein
MRLRKLLTPHSSLKPFLPDIDSSDMFILSPFDPAVNIHHHENRLRYDGDVKAGDNVKGDPSESADFINNPTTSTPIRRKDYPA